MTKSQGNDNENLNLRTNVPTLNEVLRTLILSLAVFMSNATPTVRSEACCLERRQPALLLEVGSARL